MQECANFGTKLRPKQLLVQKNILFGTELPATKPSGAENASFWHHFLLKVISGAEKHSFSTLDDLLSLYNNLAYFRALRGYRYLYRGHSSSSYSLQPTISRSSNASKENESHIYNRFKQICRDSECAQFKLDFFKHINDNLHKDMKINSLQRFHHPECPPRRYL